MDLTSYRESSKKVAEFLNKVPPVLLDSGTLVRVPAGQVVVRQEEPVKYAWFLLMGELLTFSETPEYTPADEYERPSSWAAADINRAIAAGVMPVDFRGAYNQATTRAEFCALAVELYENVMGKEITERATFTDTDDINVQKMAGLGVVNGMGEGRFEPNSALTREQAATLLSRLAAAMDKPFESSAPTFADNGSVSDWASAAVGEMQLSGVMGGVGEGMFDPKGSYTREQSIITMLRTHDIVIMD